MGRRAPRLGHRLGHRLVRRLDAADPGAIRRLRAVRATLAALSAWVTLTVAVPALTDQPARAAALFGAVTAFVGALVVSDLARRSRLLTLMWSLLGAVAATTLAALVDDDPLLAHGLLLALVFGALAARRWGQRAGSVALVITMTAYFASTLGASLPLLVPFLVAAASGLCWLAVWQFVLLPYDPRAGVVRAGTSFFHRVEETLDEVLAVLEPGSEAGQSRRAEVALRRLHLCRQVIETQLPALLAPGGRARAGIEHLQLALTSAEQGMATMVDAALADARPPADGTTGRAREGLVVLRQGLRDEQVTVVMPELERILGPLESDLARGAHQVARAATAARSLLDALREPEPTASVDHGMPAALPPRPGAAARLPLSTVLGLQAATAVGASMLVGALLGLDHVDWMFWTSFVVIAGSAGESVRRVLLRVLGTVAGGVLGLFAAWVMPDARGAVLVMVVVGIYGAMYVASVSYSLMAFWITFGMVMVGTRFGAPPLELVVERSVATVLGGAVAAVVVLTIFPVRLGRRYESLLTAYLDAVADTVTAARDSLSDATTRPAAQRALAAAAAANEELRRAMSAAAWESSPFPRTSTSLSTQLTDVAAIDASLARVVRALPEPGDRKDAAQVATAVALADLVLHDVESLRARIHRTDVTDAHHQRRAGSTAVPVHDGLGRSLGALHDALTAAETTVAAAQQPVAAIRRPTMTREGTVR